MFRNKNGQLSLGKIIAAAVAIIAVLVIIASCFTVVPAGHTGVVVNMGRVSESVLQEGFHFKAPFVQEIVQIDNRIVKLEVATDAFSKDLQTVSTVLAVNYRIAKNMSYSIYKEVGSGFEEVLVMPAVNEVLKAVVAKYTASDLVASRSEVSVMLDEELNTKLNSRGIFIEDLNIIDWDFSAEYIAAVEAKQVAEQNLIKTRTEQEEQIVIANAEAEKKRIAAQADSDSAIIAAKAEAERIRIEAEATANRIITESLNESVLKYKTIEKWDGQLPRVSLGEGAAPLIEVPVE
jgi:prohibitin 2